ncbi:SAM-dependent methyltransferase [Sulfurifustis variabilis]|uniref:SAM-dependent methyltransferase n=1 Tax=Sulfurifustis variabilis TaxID=1675686 RepID=A0A1B4VCI0_9GAMM|nr:class I SAM-dependent rRNA methyltransferase [Sulfurifustis variabilis]BAU49291.1 SAM-dependent methyltransferase [Sulfurifustis variabilis]
MTLARLRLNKNEDRRIRAGHVWVFSNEVNTSVTPLAQFEPGQPVLIEDANGHALGAGYVNPHALICARLVSRHSDHLLDQSLITHRLNVALSLRERLYEAPYYRLVFGDSDGLPGLVVDRYGELVVAQITTAGMERLKPEIAAALQKVVHPSALLFRNDSASRELEGLPRYVETAFGEVPESVMLEEHGVRFAVSPQTGQKTGWFYDQRPNRMRLRHYVKELKVLDVFSYLGAWGIQAAAAGAESVLCIESSQRAAEAIRANAELNGVGARVSTLRADAFEALRDLRSARERFDVVVLDPPAFIKRKKDVREGTQAYQRVNQMAMQVLAKDGVLVSCSCSYHMQRDALVSVLLRTGHHLDRFLEIVEEGHQGPDHPVHPAIPETSYLKCFFARVLPG